MERDPEDFEKAKAHEKNAIDHGSPFTWSEGKSLDELARPEQVAQIRADHEKRLARMGARRRVNPLQPEVTLQDLDEIYGQTKVCLACHK